VYSLAAPPDPPPAGIELAREYASRLFSLSRKAAEKAAVLKRFPCNAVALRWGGLRIIARSGGQQQPIEAMAGRVQRFLKRWAGLKGRLAGMPLLLTFIGQDKAIPLQKSFLWTFTVIPGVDGLLMRRREGNAYLLPEETLHPDFVGGQVFSFLPLRFGVSRSSTGSALRSTAVVAAGECRAVALPGPGKRRDIRGMRRFRVRSFYCRMKNGQLEVIPCFRLAGPVAERLDSEVIRSSAVAAGDWFLTHLDSNRGVFSYRYQPWTGAVRRLGYSLPRHAGSVLILYRIYGLTEEKRHLEAGDHALRYLLRRLKPAARGLYVSEGWGRGKLGSSALTALALFERRSVTGEKKYDTTINRILDFIEFMQLPSGRLSPYYQIHSRRPDPVTIAQNFPGQALWALARGIRYLGREPSVFIRGMDFQTTRAWNFFLSDYYIFPFSWEMQAIYEIGAKIRRAAWEGFLFRVADSMFDFQYTGQWPFRDYRGGFGTPEWFVPLAHAAGFQGEGLSAAYGYAKQFRLTGRVVRYGKRLRSMSRFLLSQQVTALNALLYPEPDRAVGAFRAGPADHRQQIDYTQHVLAALLNSLQEGVYRHD